MRSRLLGRALLTVASLALVEGVLRLLFMLPWLSERPLTNDSLSWRRKWVATHRAGVTLLDGVGAYDAVLGWRVRGGLDGRPLWGGWPVTTNAQGFRALVDFTLEKRAGRPRVAILGDSFTFGVEVGDGETFCERLAERLPWVEVLNFGVPAYGHDQMLLLLEREVLAYRPDVVVLAYVETDSARNLLSFRDFAKPRFRLGSAGLTIEGVPVPTPDEVLRTDWRRPRWADLGSAIGTRLGSAIGWRGGREQRLTRAILARWVASAEEAGARPLLVYLPYGRELQEEGRHLGRDAAFRRHCGATLPCGSLLEGLRNGAAAGQMLAPNGHWSATGHALAAAELARLLVDRELVARQSTTPAAPAAP